MAKRKNLSLNKILNTKKPPKTVGGWIVLVLLVLAAFLWQGLQNPAPNAPIAEGDYIVDRCVDGDTLLLTNKVRVRLIGANTPETVKPNSPVEPFGPEASKYTADRVTRAGNRVTLTFDGTSVDKYGRVLAMVWVEGSLLNEDLIFQGLARAETQYNYSSEMKNRFTRAENEAKKAKRGIWSSAP